MFDHSIDIMKATILDSLVRCSLITAMCSLISLVILCRHSLKTPNKNNNKTNCLQIAFHFLQPRVSFYFWEMFTFIFPNMVPPSLNLSCHLLSPPIRPPIHPIVNSCPSLKRTSTLTFTFSIQFSNWPCCECGHNEFPLAKLLANERLPYFMLFLTILTLPILKIPVLPPLIQCFINVNLRMLLMKEYNPDKHARIHFLLDHTQARGLFFF